MKFDAVSEVLSSLPSRLPEPPAVLMPIRVGGGADRPWPGSPASGRPAAVLVLFIPDAAGDARVVLTERVVGGRHHSGEVSFPGGRAEAGDPDLVATAMREAAEEIDLRPEEARVRVVGTLEPFWIPVSNYLVTPVVAMADARPSLAAAPAEVARIVEAPIDAFSAGAPITIVERRIGEWTIRYGVYAIDGLSVWGATARILGQFGALLGAQRAARRPRD